VQIPSLYIITCDVTAHHRHDCQKQSHDDPDRENPAIARIGLAIAALDQCLAESELEEVIQEILSEKSPFLYHDDPEEETAFSCISLRGGIR